MCRLGHRPATREVWVRISTYSAVLDSPHSVVMTAASIYFSSIAMSPRFGRACKWFLHKISLLVLHDAVTAWSCAPDRPLPGPCSRQISARVGAIKPLLYFANPCLADRYILRMALLLKCSRGREFSPSSRRKTTMITFLQVHGTEIWYLLATRRGDGSRAC